ncbi:MAG TPA: DUF6516 family protein [Candidatus Methanoperedens sp.]
MKSNSSVKKIIVVESIVLPENEKLTAIVHLTDSSILHIKERYRNGSLIKYSYHNIRSDKFIRWDNVPHHRNLETFPDHKHENTMIVESRKMNISLVFKELGK